MSLDEFEAKVAPCIPETDVREAFLAQTAAAFNSHEKMVLGASVYCATVSYSLTLQTSPSIDVFIREAMFQSVTQAQRQLREAMASSARPVCWGNTNLAPRDYKQALADAALAHRSVHFIRWCAALLSLRSACVRRVGDKSCPRCRSRSSYAET